MNRYYYTTIIFSCNRLINYVHTLVVWDEIEKNYRHVLCCCTFNSTTVKYTWRRKTRPITPAEGTRIINSNTGARGPKPLHPVSPFRSVRQNYIYKPKHVLPRARMRFYTNHPTIHPSDDGIKVGSNAVRSYLNRSDAAAGARCRITITIIFIYCPTRKNGLSACGIVGNRINVM